MLLIDELDRADEAFEAYLLEVLADNQVTVPELGTFRAAAPPIVIVTTNRTREIHDALKRRCLYHWIDYPGRVARARDRPHQGARRRRAAVARGRRLRPAARARAICSRAPASPRRSIGRRRLTELDQTALDPQTLSDTLGVLLKYQDDIARIDGTRAQVILDEVQAELSAAE